MSMGRKMRSRNQAFQTAVTTVGMANCVFCTNTYLEHATVANVVETFRAHTQLHIRKCAALLLAVFEWEQSAEKVQSLFRKLHP